MTRRPTALAATALLFLLLPVSVSAANGGDRNKDRIPDRWERSHDLSLKVKQTSKDQDKDGLCNRDEWRNRTNPRDADSDNDGLGDGAEVKVGSKPRDRDSDGDGKGDGDENAGTIQSFTAGTLTIALSGGTTLAAAVVDGVTEIGCADDHSRPNPGPMAARSSSAGDDDGQHHNGHGDDQRHHHGNGGQGHGHHHGNGGHRDGHGAPGHGNGPTCTVANLTAGAVVHEAEIKTMGGKAVFTKIEIIPAA
jgi:hypothetical protein